MITANQDSITDIHLKKERKGKERKRKERKGKERREKPTK